MMANQPSGLPGVMWSDEALDRSLQIGVDRGREILLSARA